MRFQNLHLTAAALLFFLSSIVASASTFTVINTNDIGIGTLRQAIIDANAHSNSLNPGSAADMISFAMNYI